MSIVEVDALANIDEFKIAGESVHVLEIVSKIISSNSKTFLISLNDRLVKLPAELWDAERFSTQAKAASPLTSIPCVIAFRIQ